MVGHQLLAARSAGDVNAGWVDALLVAEAAGIAMDVNQLVKFLAGRQRPFVHYGNYAEANRKPDPDDNLSFFSGHSTFTFAVAAAAGTVSTMRGYESAPWVWGVGLTLATATGYLRIAGDKHYLTDVLVGAGTGLAAGIAIPRLLHPRKEGSSSGGTAVTSHADPARRLGRVLGAAPAAAGLGLRRLGRRHELEHALRRAPDDGAIPGDQDRPLQDARVLRHRLDELLVRRPVGEAERLVLVRVLPRDYLRRDAEPREQRRHLAGRRRLLEEAAQHGLHAARAEQLRGALRGGAPRVEPEDVLAGHAPPEYTRGLDLVHHLGRLAALLAAERDEEKLRLDEARGRLSLAEREARGLALGDVEAIEEGALGGRTLVTFGGAPAGSRSAGHGSAWGRS